jgi:hypothetical protein
MGGGVAAGDRVRASDDDGSWTAQAAWPTTNARARERSGFKLIDEA